MTNTQIIFLSAGATLLMIVLILAAYLHGHHNGRLHLAKDRDNKPRPQGRIDPAFVLQAIEDGVIMVDPSGVIKLFNPAAARLTGWQENEVIGLDYRSVLSLVDAHGKPYSDNKRPFNIVLTTGRTVRENSSLFVTRSGKQVPISLIVSPINPSEGGGAIAVFRDITKEKAEESERAEFISTASHEMRTPLASIEGYLSLVLNSKDMKLDKSAKEYLQKAHSETQHLGQLFQDLLTTTKAEDSRLISHPVVVDLGSLLSESVEVARKSAEKKNLSLHYLTSGETPSTGKVVKPLFYVNADPTQLKEVVQNLLDNAIKYTSAGGVTVRLTGDSSVAQIQVSDTGVGIPPEDIPHLFQKFYRVDSSLTRRVGGTGLGLFICRKILDLYNGRIWVESKLGKGSTFFVNVPRVENRGAVTGKTVRGVVQS